MATMRGVSQRCFGIAGGLLLDRCLGEPPTVAHPVAWFGAVMGGVERVVWAPRRDRGLVYTAVGVGLGWAFGRLVRSTALAVAVAVAGRMLRATAASIGRTTLSGDVDVARAELPSLVGRDPSELDASGIAAAVIESVAENSVDAVIAPAFWAVFGGAPGASVYRAINTMDAMVGHRSDRYGSFGWAAARLDDVANYVPARVFALLVATQAPARAPEVFRTIRRGAPAHPSPNAGVAESAMAGLLGIELGGPLRYGTRVEERPTLGSGRRPEPTDVLAAVRIANHAELLALGLLAMVGIAMELSRVGDRPRGSQRR